MPILLKNKKIVLLLAILLALACSAACGKENSQSQSGSKKAKEASGSQEESSSCYICSCYKNKKTMVKELLKTKNVQDVVRVWSQYNAEEWSISDDDLFAYNRLVATTNADVDLRYVWTSASDRQEAALAVEEIIRKNSFVEVEFKDLKRIGNRIRDCKEGAVIQRFQTTEFEVDVSPTAYNSLFQAVAVHCRDAKNVEILFYAATKTSTLREQVVKSKITQQTVKSTMTRWLASNFVNAFKTCA